MANETDTEVEEFDTGDETEEELPVEDELATQALVDFALAQEPASFKDALGDIMLDKCSGLVDGLREELSKSTLTAEGKFPFKKKGEDDDDDDDDKGKDKDKDKDKDKKKDKDDDDDDDDKGKDKKKKDKCD